MVVRKFKPLMIEAVVRGYIIGSGWKDYQKTGAVCGIKLPAGLQEAQKLPKLDLHAGHQGAGRPARRKYFVSRKPSKSVGDRTSRRRCARMSIQLYSEAADYARSKGIIIADTKFEFGVDAARQARI